MTTPKLIDAVIDFSSHAVSAEIAVVAPERMVSGEPCHTTTWNHYSDPSGQFFAGIWASGVGAITVSYSEEELCYVLEGRVWLRAARARGRRRTWRTLPPATHPWT